MSKPLKVFGVVNHVGNQFEMLKLTRDYDVEFTYLENNVRRWSEWSARPIPEDLKWATEYEPGKYDVAILHVDQQHVDPAIGKGKLYREMNAVIQDIPKIVINHGTPMWPEMYEEDMVINGGDAYGSKGEPKHIDGMKTLIGDNFMVVNSYEAVDRWGWGYPLIHGMEAGEWWDLPKEPRPCISLSPGGLDAYYNRQLLTQIKSNLAERAHIILKQANIEYKLDGGSNWDNYRDFIGRSLIGVYMMRDSPMPRSRTEGMFSGQCILSSPYHDAEGFIENGVNGFIVPDNPLSYTELIEQLINFKYKEAVEIGQNAKETAAKYFNLERYLSDMHFIISEVAAGRRPEWDGSKLWAA